MYDVVKISPSVEMNVVWRLNESNESLLTEAVFVNGKKSLESIVQHIQRIKDELDREIDQHNQSYQNKDTKLMKFNPSVFWRNVLFKDLEDSIEKQFGFRSVSIQPFIETYNPEDGTFESKMLNCAIWGMNRYPIEGLVSDNGFYDKSRSISITIHASLGLIKALTADEIMAVILHEFGHGIDPALVDIKYTETNILSKYLTDRKHKINRSEKRYIDKCKLGDIVVIPFIALSNGFGTIADAIYRLIHGEEALLKKKLEKVRKIVEKDKDRFNRQNFSEAFADNFARMYGYGIELVHALQKMNKDNHDQLQSRCKRERERQRLIIEITEELINDVHKTDIHRIRSLIKEYEADISDPNIDDVVKQQLREDMEELERVLDEYMNNFSEFQNRVNRVINEELSKIDSASTSNVDEEIHEESTMYADRVDYLTEKKKWEILKEKREKAEKAVTPEDRKAIHEKFGYSHACSFGRDKDGIYCYTHRCRSKSYESIEKMPKKAYDFVCSTS